MGVGIHLGEGDCTLPLIGFSATPSSLWPGCELQKFHCFVRGTDIQFSRYVYQFWAFPLAWGVALAVTIVYLKTECFFRRSYLRFLSLKNRKQHFRFQCKNNDNTEFWFCPKCAKTRTFQKKKNIYIYMNIKTKTPLWTSSVTLPAQRGAVYMLLKFFSDCR